MYEKYQEKIKRALNGYCKIANEESDNILDAITSTEVRPQGWKLHEINTRWIAQKVLFTLEKWYINAGYNWNELIENDKIIAYTPEEVEALKEKKRKAEAAKYQVFQHDWNKHETYGT